VNIFNLKKLYKYNIMSNYIIYILLNRYNNYTYVGITNNEIRRLRQHNGELKGGAKYTTNNKKEGHWEYYAQIRNVEKCTALSIEKKIKLRTKKYKGTPIEKRILAVNNILPLYENLKLEIL